MFDSSVRQGIRWAQRSLFALNLAFGAILGLEFGYDRVFVPVIRLERALYSEWGIRSGGGVVSGYLAFAICVATLGLLVLLIMHLIRSTPVADCVLLYGGGLAAASVAPACWVYIQRRYGLSWYPLEIAVCCVLVLLYAILKRPIPAASAIVIAAIHFGFWGLRVAAYEYNPLGNVAMLIGFCACVAWILYVPNAPPQTPITSSATPPS
jgi:hypothetical protein